MEQQVSQKVTTGHLREAINNQGAQKSANEKGKVDHAKFLESNESPSIQQFLGQSAPEESCQEKQTGSPCSV